MTIARGGHGKVATTFAVPLATATTPTTTTTGGAGSCYHIFSMWFTSSGAVAPTVISDSKSNVYTIVQSIVSDAGDGRFRAGLWRSLGENGGPAGVPTVGGTLHTATVTFAGNQDAISIWFDETTGGATSGMVDQSPAGAEDLTTPFTAPSVTTTQAVERVITFAANGAVSGTETISWAASGFASTGDNISDVDNNLTGDIADRITSSTGTFAGAFTSSSGGTNLSLMFSVSLKDAAGTAASDLAESAGRRQLRCNANYRMSPRAEREAQQFLRAQKRAYAFAA